MRKTLYKIIIVIFPFFLLSCNSINYTTTKKDVLTKYTELKIFFSEEVKDSFYLYIRVPKNYEKENKSYPVLYLLDGDISFNMATSIVRYLQYAKDVPEIIIVGIGYGSMMNDDKINYRERDYSISKNEMLKLSGGGEKFLNFIKNELIPYIDKNYKTSDKRYLNGYSLGGLFAIYTLIKNMNLFNGYIAGSPYLKNDIEQLLSSSNNLDNYSGKIFVSFGELESEHDYKIPIQNLTRNIKSVLKNDKKIKLQIFENGTHYSCPPEALTYGLQFIFSEN